MRVLVTAALGLAGLATLAAPSMAADQTVHAVGAVEGDYGAIPEHFEPATARINPGESVTFVNDSGQHNVRFTDGLFTSPSAPLEPPGWPSPPAKRIFPRGGIYRFLCDLHGASGMTGSVIVGSPGAPGTPGAPGSGSPTGSPGALEIQAASMLGRRFCNRRGRRCRRPGVRLTIDLSKAGRVTGKLSRRPLRGHGRARRFGMLDFGTVEPGPRRLRFTRTKSGRRLPSGRYVLTLKAGEDRRVLRFSVAS